MASAFQEAEELFLTVLEQPPNQRQATLKRLTKNNPSLYQQVQHLLEKHEEASRYLHSLQERVIHEVSAADIKNRIGERLSVYELTHHLGSGGMADVFQAKRCDGKFEQTVAIKIMKRGMDTQAVLNRFMAEQQILASLNHPNIASIYDAGMTPDGLPFFVMEHIEGVPVDQYVKQHQCTTEEVLKIVMHVLEALQYAHSNLVLHRDMKPSNILVTNAGYVKLVDFGIAKIIRPETKQQTITEPENKVLTLDYASPEMLHSFPLTTASDTYQVGLVLYTLLAGRNPFSSTRDMEERKNKIKLVLPPPPIASQTTHREGISRSDLNAVTIKSILKEPEIRYGTAASFLSDLQNLLAGLPVSAKSDTGMYRFKKFIARNKAASLAVALVFLSLIGGIIATSWQAEIAKQERQLARQEAAKANELTDFLLSLFQSGNPQFALGENFTAQDLLRRGTMQINQIQQENPIKNDLLKTMAIAHSYAGELVIADSLFRVTEASLDRKNQQAKWDELHYYRIKNLLHLNDFAHADSLLKPFMLGLARRGETGLLLNCHVLQAKSFRDQGQLPLASDQIQIADSLFDTYPEQVEIPERVNMLRIQAAIANATGQLEKSRIIIKEALTLCENNESMLLEKNHALVNLATIYSQTGKFEASDSIYSLALPEAIALYHDTHPYVSSIRINKGMMYYYAGRYLECISILEPEIPLVEASLGVNHPILAIHLNLLGNACFEVKEYDKARTYLNRSEDIYLRIFGPQHPNYASVLLSKGKLASVSGQHQTAKADVEKSIEILSTAYSDMFPELVEHYLTLADLYEKENRGQQAISCYRKAYQISNQQVPEPVTTTLSLLLTLAEKYYEYQNPDSATYYLAQFEGRKDNPKPPRLVQRKKELQNKLR